MSRHEYYEKLKSLAREIRAKYGLSTPHVGKSDFRRIYKDQGIRIDLWPYRCKNLRGAYFNDGIGPPSVMLVDGLPYDPTIFTLGHELKHHLTDRGVAVAYCHTSNENEPIEIGAEIFSAEVIYPEQDFSNHLAAMGVGAGKCTPELLVRLKRETRTTLSYASLSKRVVYLGFGAIDGFTKVKWKALEEKMYGAPFYKRRNQFRRGRSGN